MDINNTFVFYLIIWFIVAGFVIFIKWKDKSNNCGLTLFYILGFSIIYMVAPAFYILPWQEFSQKEWVLCGFRESTYGLISFAIGNIFLTQFFLRRQEKYKIENQNNYIWTNSNFPYVYFWLSLLMYLIASYRPINIPTIQAIGVVFNNFMAVNICLICWQAYCNKNFKELRKWLILSLFLPLLTLTFGGFFGYGVGLSMLVFVFTFRFFRRFIRIILVYIIMSYLGFSIYVTYMRDRDIIRDTVWGGAPIIKRITTIVNTFKNIEWFNPSNPRHLISIDGRLNQNVLVGAAIEYIKNGFASYAYGQTIYESIVLGFIPRILYPEKPVYAGSGNLVSKFTGLEFDPTTSVGVGQVMEFYINFGRMGVIIGFMIIGVLLGIFDTLAAHYLSTGNIYKFILWFLPGLFLNNPGGALVEVTTSIGAGFIFVFLIAKIKLEKSRTILFIIFLIMILYLINIILFH